nr:hypothetical protein [Tanacetum cinerariifolium]
KRDQKVVDLEDQSHQEFNTSNDDATPVRESLNNDECTQSLFNEFLATPIDFSAFIMHRLKIDNLTQEVLTGPTYDLLKGTCKSVVELEYHLEEVFKATNDQLDWHNLEGKPYSYDLSKPLPLILKEQGRQVILWDYFINNDLEYLRGGSQNRRDQPKEIPLDSVEVLRYNKRSKSEIKGKVTTEMELVLEHTQQGTSYEVLVNAEGVEELKRNLRIKGVNKEALHILKAETGSINMLSETLSCCRVLKIAVMDPVTQCTTLP